MAEELCENLFDSSDDIVLEKGKGKDKQKDNGIEKVDKKDSNNAITEGDRLMNHAHNIVTKCSQILETTADVLAFSDCGLYVFNTIKSRMKNKTPGAKLPRDYTKQLTIAPAFCQFDVNNDFKHCRDCPCRGGGGKRIPRRRLFPAKFTDELCAKLRQCSQKDPLWQEMREHLLTASNAIVFAGYKTMFSDTMMRFAIDKAIILDPFISTSAVKKGVVCEDLVAQFIATRLKTFIPNEFEFQQVGMNIPEDKSMRFIGASPDRIIHIVDQHNTQLVLDLMLEIKVTSWNHQFIPNYYMAQLQMNMHMAHTNWGWFAMASVSDREPYIVKKVDIRVVQYQPAYFKILLDRMAMYAYCLKNDIAPLPCLFAAYPPIPLVRQTGDPVIIYSNDDSKSLSTKFATLFEKITL